LEPEINLMTGCDMEAIWLKQSADEALIAIYTCESSKVTTGELERISEEYMVLKIIADIPEVAEWAEVWHVHCSLPPERVIPGGAPVSLKVVQGLYERNI